jgi:hypothetical protein
MPFFPRCQMGSIEEYFYTVANNFSALYLTWMKIS